MFQVLRDTGTEGYASDERSGPPLTPNPPASLPCIARRATQGHAESNFLSVFKELIMSKINRTFLTLVLGLGLLLETANAGILDDVSTSASAAYSSRKLRDAYAGSALRLRRSSDNVEADFGFVGAYLDEAAITTWLASSTGYVTTWYDQSGNSGRNYVQATESLQPIYTPGAVGPELRPVVANTVGTHHLVASFNQSLGYTRVLYVQQTGGSSVFTSTTGPRQELQSYAGVSDFFFYGNQIGVKQIPNADVGLNASDYYLIDYQWNGTSIVVGFDGGARDTIAATTTTTSPTGFSQGGMGDTGGYGMTGNFLEEIIFDGALSEADRALINTSVNDYLTETIPEPATMSLLAIGGLGVLLKRRRRRA
jgi:hypothetical protein